MQYVELKMIISQFQILHKLLNSTLLLENFVSRVATVTWICFFSLGIEILNYQ
jgi:hypothetical protein